MWHIWAWVQKVGLLYIIWSCRNQKGSRIRWERKRTVGRELPSFPVWCTRAANLMGVPTWSFPRSISTERPHPPVTQFKCLTRVPCWYVLLLMHDRRTRFSFWTDSFILDDLFFSDQGTGTECYVTPYQIAVHKYMWQQKVSFSWEFLCSVLLLCCALFKVWDADAFIILILQQLFDSLFAMASDASLLLKTIENTHLNTCNVIKSEVSNLTAFIDMFIPAFQKSKVYISSIWGRLNEPLIHPVLF